MPFPARYFELSRLAKSVGVLAANAAHRTQEWGDDVEGLARSVIPALEKLEALLLAYKPATSKNRTFEWGEALALHKAGMSIREIAKRLGKTRQTIQRALRKQDVPPQPNRCENRRNIDAPLPVECYKAGMTLKQLGIAFNASERTMARVIRQGGGALRAPGERTTATSDQIKSIAQQAIDRKNEVLYSLAIALPCRVNENPSECATCQPAAPQPTRQALLTNVPSWPT